MGFKVFRVSINWTRIYPNGDEDKPNKKGLDFYRSLFKELKKYNIEPLVTLSHYEEPIGLLKKYNGWASKTMITDFVKYAKTCFTEFHNLVKYWLTFNEINISLMGAGDFMSLDMMPKSDVPMMSLGGSTREDINRRFNALNNQFIASAKAVQIAHSIDQSLKVGCMIAGGMVYPLTPNPIDCFDANYKMELANFFCGDVMVRGEYSPTGKRLLRESGVVLELNDDEKEILKKGTVDFYSFSYYMSNCTTKDPDQLKTAGNVLYGVKNPYLKSSEYGWQIDPLGLRLYLNEVYNRYHIPLMVVENGLGTADVFDDVNKTVHDSYRVDYLKAHVNAMKEAIKDGVDLMGYTWWAPIDLVSASTGEMKKRYGFIYVDKNNDGSGTLKRYKKDSFFEYKKIIENNGDID